MPMFNWPGQDQESLQNNGRDFFSGLGNWWNQINKPLTGISVDEEKRQQIAKQGYGFSDRDQMGDLQRRGLMQGDPARNPGGSGEDIRAILSGKFNRNVNATDSQVGQGTVLAPEGGMPELPSALSAEEQRMADTIAAIQQRLQQGYHDDGTYNALIDQAFGGSLAAIDTARGKANENYQESDKVLGGLTDGLVNIIKTEDASNIKKTGAEYEQGVNQNYDQAVGSIQDDRTREINDRMEAMKRLGLEASGMQDVGADRTHSINDLTEEKAGAITTAKGTTAADLQMNTARAQGQATAGVERRSSLRQDLDKILGGLDGQVAEIENSKAQARLQAQQADKQQFLNTQKTDADTLEMYYNQNREDKKFDREMSMQEMKLGAKAKGTGTAYDVAGERMFAKGVDPTPILQAYSEVMAENRFNSNSGQDMTAFLVHEMNKRLSGKVNPEDTIQWLDMIKNYGTDKANAVL